MGVPAFFMWLSTRYPKILIDLKNDSELEEEISREEDKHQEVSDLSQLNMNPTHTNNVQIDNLYLDMNGIIHPCSHPENGPQPTNEIDMFNNIFKYIDKIVRMVKPKKILYMAIDGVAPRAKMNQQRSRRFRSALDAQLKDEKEKQLRNEWKKRGRHLPPQDNLQSHFDSNVITPGTMFMDKLAKSIRYYISERIKNDPLWKNLTVFLSDAKVPGEGEHKILEFIRLQRAQPGYDPNISHCLYGADADLIHLGLSTHEVNFYILREVVIPRYEIKCAICGQKGHLSVDCQGYEKKDKTEFNFLPFQYISLPILRQYLELEFCQLQLPFELDFERILDDFVFFCFFVGNDFLPHLPSLYIREGGLDILMFLYKKLLPSLGGYLTLEGEINFSRVDVILMQLGAVEEEFFKQKMHRQVKNEYYRIRRKKEEETKELDSTFAQYVKIRIQEVENKMAECRHIKNQELAYIQQQEQALAKLNKNKNQTNNNDDDETTLEDFKSQKEKIYGKFNKKMEMLRVEKEKLVNSKRVFKDNLMNSHNYYERYSDGFNITENHLINDFNKFKQIHETKKKEEEEKKKIDEEESLTEEQKNKVAAENFKSDLKGMLREIAENEANQYVDNIQLGKAGYKSRYYSEKFNIEEEDFMEFRDNIQRAYLQGLCWVYAYYYKGCISWSWYYPFHYAPFASDLINSDQVPLEKFQLSKPFKPFEQLMGVLPPASGHCLPRVLKTLIKDNFSPIADFYPKFFKLDINGQRYAWMGVNLLPFIDKDRLKSSIVPLFETLTDEEKKRNSFGEVEIFIHKETKFGYSMLQRYQKNNIDEKLDFNHGFEISGSIKVSSNGIPLESAIKKPFPNLELADIESNNALTVVFDNPPYVPHRTQILEGSLIGQKIISMRDIEFIDRRTFQGENSIRMVERALRIEKDPNDAMNKNMFNRQEPEKVFSSSYNTNRGIMSQPTTYKNQPPSQLGKRMQRDYPLNPSMESKKMKRNPDYYNERQGMYPEIQGPNQQYRPPLRAERQYPNQMYRPEDNHPPPKQKDSIQEQNQMLFNMLHYHISAPPSQQPQPGNPQMTQPPREGMSGRSSGSQLGVRSGVDVPSNYFPESGMIYGSQQLGNPGYLQGTQKEKRSYNRFDRFQGR